MSDQATDNPRRERRLRPWLAALLCLLTPGLGLFYDGLFRAGLTVSVLSAAGFLAIIFSPELGLISFAGIFGLIAFQVLLVVASMIAAGVMAWRRRVTQRHYWNDFYGLMFVTFAMGLAIEAPWQLIGLPIEPFSIPSGSMMPATVPGDHLVALHWNRINRLPLRGEIVIFRRPVERTDYVKRVIGLPGDSVQLQDNIVIVNGQKLPRKSLDEFIYPNPSGGAVRANQFEETSPDGIVYRILTDPRGSPLASTRVFIVPPGHIFVLGDNRDNSMDSRLSQVGFIPAENLRARPVFFYYARNPSRIGAEVR